MVQQRWMWIAWPAFLVAGLMEVFVFVFVDPRELHWLGQELVMSRQAVYTLAFFSFWGLTMLSSGLTALLSNSSFGNSRDPVALGDRPSDGIQGKDTLNAHKAGPER